MPIYCYKCSVCGEEIELLQKVNDDPPKCPKANDDTHQMVKQISTTSFVLRGGGWYKDGYTKKDKPNES